MPLKKPANVIYFTAVMYNPQQISVPDTIITETFGTNGIKSSLFTFDHTEYYSPEMGGGLMKYFVSFGAPAEPSHLPELKHRAILKENELARYGKRIINIDPGYLATEKIVVASTKNFTHRIYLTDGIFGDLQLMRTKGRYTAMPWTYADYMRTEAVEFFDNLYNTYKAEF